MLSQDTMLPKELVGQAKGWMGMGHRLAGMTAPTVEDVRHELRVAVFTLGVDPSDPESWPLLKREIVRASLAAGRTERNHDGPLVKYGVVPQPESHAVAPAVEEPDPLTVAQAQAMVERAQSAPPRSRAVVKAIMDGYSTPESIAAAAFPHLPAHRQQPAMHEAMARLRRHVGAPRLTPQRRVAK